MNIIRPLLGRLTQGYIFSCARAENYHNCNVFGFVITARCDVDQNKFPIMNYIPVVTLDDWLLQDGFDILASRINADIDGSLLNVMKEHGIAESILFSKTYDEVGNSFFSQPYEDKKHKANSDRFFNLLNKKKFISEICLNRSNNSADLYKCNEKMSSSLLGDLSAQKISGFYFLPSVYDSNDDAGYVLLLREVSHLSRQAALAVASGFDGTKQPELGAQYGLNFDFEPFSMPIGEVPSPNVEHILQAFAQLFGRIGLADLPRDYLNKIVARRPRAEEAR